MSKALYGPTLPVIMISAMMMMMMMMSLGVSAQPAVNDDDAYCQPRTLCECKIHSLNSHLLTVQTNHDF